ncbi:alpha-amylase family glycosyl hydrolase [Alloacidobacterium sp.]|uniref:alpha-amylase family glycosyl hydrolase n=1 Tax=Alloacidobacterium sp. TaxID=2951999 RepID=UPI002D459B56|nr:alpha-amylase family glycosyl hydrolase [Alloacidobacterium sp.]HYK36090.1 alpha-amylase family glycosyl hydrolase [Alloacidobacterium sp.]
MEFHISRAVREGLEIDGLLFAYTGNVVFANVAASRKLASQLNQARGTETDSSKAINAGALFAMGLIDELSHALVARYRKEIDPAVHTQAIRWFSSKINQPDLEKLLLAFVEQFPNVAVYRGEMTAQQWLNGTTEGMSNREATLEELMLLWLANINPAFVPFRELFDDKDLKSQTAYQNVTADLPGYLSTRPPLAPEAGSLFEALRAPMLAAPDSITGQLEFIRTHWSKYLTEDLRRLLLAIDVLREEELAIWLRFHPPGPDWHRHGAPTWGAQGFRGDEFVGFEEDFGHKRYAHDYQAPLHEYEAFSADQAWMPNVVLIAKSTYVWLEQLSKKYSRHIHRLNQIPDEELRLLADRGITGLWLIGLWERSIASRTIKRLRGQSDAVASAYSLKEYDIAEDLGGYSAYEDLRNRAAHFRIRLASDMVPNHMGIDSEWVIEHPDWFISRWESPFPAYSFNGPDLSTDSRVEIKIEDHYYDQTDAAVAFRLRHHHDGTTRYIYHGNDGTSFAWNDTAQLDYSKAEVRERVIQTILHVARQFPIIRFDAAMVLAKRHVQRLWFPLPGTGGSIPSRAENAMSQEEFDAIMPHEFWREVVDRVATEVPGTLLLAEAFWLLEAYFVRTLGMHRVYNSAFMNMLRDEENAKYRSYLKKTIEFDPDVLKRYVNFMSNPDERTAIDQFGTGDKYFGVCTLLATLPGLPMFGHGQIEGFTERYGMEFKQARMDEHPNEWLVERHQREIAPLLKNRRLFAESHNFVLYDFWNDHGSVDENVFAYSNRLDDQRSLIVYNNTYGSTRGTIHISAAFMDKVSGQLKQTSLARGLDIAHDDSVIFAYRDTAHGLEYLRRATDIHRHGLKFELRGFQHTVLVHWRELRVTADQPWDRLCDALHGDGVYSVDEALTRLRLQPLHEALHRTIDAASASAFAEVAGKEAQLYIAKTRKKRAVSTGSQQPQSIPLPDEHAAIDTRLHPFIEKAQHFCEKAIEFMPHEHREALEAPDGPAHLNQRFRKECEAWATAALHLPLLEHGFSTAWPASVRYMLPSEEPGASIEQTWSPVLAWILLRSFSPQGMSADLFDKLMLRSALAETFSSLGMEGERAWQAAARVRTLLSHIDLPSDSRMHAEAFWADPDVKWLTGVNESSGTTYFNKEQFEEMLSWIQLPALLAITRQPAFRPSAIEDLEEGITKASEAARDAGYRLDKYLDLLHVDLPAEVVHEGDS